jgi:hypothetical protein
MDVKFQKVKKKTKFIGSFSYDDPATPLSLNSTKITSLTFNGNQAHFTGTAKIGKSKVTFTVDVTDNGVSNDFFSLQVSNGYSASGYLTSGHIAVH